MDIYAIENQENGDFLGTYDAESEAEAEDMYRDEAEYPVEDINIVEVKEVIMCDVAHAHIMVYDEFAEIAFWADDDPAYLHSKHEVLVAVDDLIKIEG